MRSFSLSFILIFCTLIAFSQEVTRITDKVIVINQGYDRVSAIKTEKGIVVIDTHKSTYDMKKCKKLIVDEFKEKRFAYIINTHSCQEHIAGNPLFPKVKKIAHHNFYNADRTPTDGYKAHYEKKLLKMQEDADKAKGAEKKELTKKMEYYRQMGLDYMAAYVPPNISFTDKMKLDMGDLTLELFHMGKGAHGDASIGIYLPEEKTLFTGSAFTSPPILYPLSTWCTDIGIEKWIEVLDDIITNKKPENIIHSHIVYYTVDDIREMKNYYVALLEKTLTAVKQGTPLDGLMKDFTYEKACQQCKLYKENDEKDQARHKKNVEILYGWAMKR